MVTSSHRWWDHPAWEIIIRCVAIVSLLVATWLLISTRQRLECQDVYMGVLSDSNQALREALEHGGPIPPDTDTPPPRGPTNVYPWHAMVCR
jgi:hypothetical protein